MTSFVRKHSKRYLQAAAGIIAAAVRIGCSRAGGLVPALIVLALSLSPGTDALAAVPRTSGSAAAVIALHDSTAGNTADKEMTAAVSSCIDAAAAYLTANVGDPGCASVGGDWTVFGLARSGRSVPEGYFQRYYRNIRREVLEKGEEPEPAKHTENARMVLALTAADMDPRNVAGRNLLRPLADFDGTVRQGINGAVFALLALDAGDYEMPLAAPGRAQASRQRYVDYILAKELPDGGWNLRGSGSADADITAMVLQALAAYRTEASADGTDAVTDKADAAAGRSDEAAGRMNGKVSRAVERALACLGKMTPDNCESAAQMVLAYCTLGMDPGRELVGTLLDFHCEDGGFRHGREDSESNLMATEQAFYALVAAERYDCGQSSLYRCAQDRDLQEAA